MTERPVLLVDTREQNPLKFSLYKERFSAIVRMTLNAGDYSILDHEDRISFERKSLADLVGTLASRDNQQRFFRELERLKNHEYVAIVIEATFEEVNSPYQYSRIHPQKIIGLLQAIQTRYNVDVIFAGSRANAEEIIVKRIEALIG